MPARRSAKAIRSTRSDQMGGRDAYNKQLAPELEDRARKVGHDELFDGVTHSLFWRVKLLTLLHIFNAVMEVLPYIITVYYILR